MDTFMDKLAEKRNTQNPSASSALKNIPKNSEFHSIQQTNMKRQQIQQSFLNEAFIMDQINTLKELQENKKEEIKSFVMDGNGKQVELITQSMSELTQKEEEISRRLEDFIHKESVKCYRNIQAVVLEQTEILKENEKKNLKLVKIGLGIVSLLTLANLASFFAYILGYFK